MTIDERALDKATAALADYIRHNPPLQFVNPTTKQVDSIISIEHARACIEAYEAARPEPNPWRPIEEAAKNTDRALIDWDGDGCGAMQVCWMERHIETRRWLNGYDSMLEADFPNAMFRTIDPPPQNAPQSAVDAPTAAEDTKPFTASTTRYRSLAIGVWTRKRQERNPRE